MFMSQLIILVKILKPSPTFTQTSLKHITPIRNATTSPLSINFRLVVVVVVVSRRGPGGGAHVRIAEKILCYQAAFFFLITQMYAHC